MLSHNIVISPETLAQILSDTLRNNPELNHWVLHIYIPDMFPNQVFVDAHLASDFYMADDVILALMNELSNLTHQLKLLISQLGYDFDATNIWHPNSLMNSENHIVYNYRIAKS